MFKNEKLILRLILARRSGVPKKIWTLVNRHIDFEAGNI
jgi:hypothetical protein